MKYHRFTLTVKAASRKSAKLAVLSSFAGRKPDGCEFNLGGEPPRPNEFTETDLSEAFTEWDRRYREEPERFQSEAVRLLKETPETYGQACAPYLLQILSEIPRP